MYYELANTLLKMRYILGHACVGSRRILRWVSFSTSASSQQFSPWPHLNLFSPEWGMGFPSPSFPFLYNLSLLALLSWPFGLLAPGWLDLLAFWPSWLSPLPFPSLAPWLFLSSHDLVLPGPLQMPLAVLSLISKKKKSFSSTISGAFVSSFSCSRCFSLNLDLAS